MSHNDIGGKAARWLRCAGVVLVVLAMIPRLALAVETATETVTEATADTAVETAEAAEAALDANNNERLLLDVQVNGHSTGKIGEFTMRDGQLLARANELRDLGFRVPHSLVTSPNALIVLSDLPGLNWVLDQKNLVLRITAPDSVLLPTLLLPEGEGRERAAGHREIESGTGVTLNYDIAGTYASGQTGATGSLDFRAFTPKGVLSSDWLAYAGAATSASGKNTAIRLDSAYSYADINTLRRYVLGDFITSGLTWTRPVHLEGVQIRSDFSMRPDLVTFPLPTVTGSAAVPSTVSVLANGNLTVSNEVAAGPFEVPQLPVVSGAGTISMTVTNALGQQVTVSKPFYASSALLAPGLHIYSAQAGLVRLNWGAISNDYGKMAGAAIYRRGLNRKFTVEGSFESTSGTAAGGAGGVLQIGHLGVANFAAAVSSGSAGAGAQYSAGAQRIGRVFSLGGSAIVANRNYRDIASLNGAGVPRKQLNAFTSLSHKRLGTMGAAYAEVDQDASPTLVQQGTMAAEQSKTVSLNYSRQIHHMSIYALEYRNYTGTGNSSGMQVGLTIPLGRRRSANVSATSDGNGQAQVQQSAAQVGDWGYNASVSAGNSNHEFAQGQYKSHVGLFTAGVDQNDGETTLRLESLGALSFVDHGLFPSNQIYDSFAIVDTSPIPRVRVLQENRLVGRTNSKGRLLVPDMRSFDLNHIAIEPTDIPPDVTIDTATREMRPQDRSGVVVRFPIQFSHAALLQLVDEEGAPVPLGSVVTLRATGAIAPVGYDGDVYLENLSSHNELSIERADGRHCTVVFDYKPLPGDIPSIGPLRCQEKRP